MEDLYEILAHDMAAENNIDVNLAVQLVRWMDIEGFLDYDILKDIYMDEEDEEDDSPTGEVIPLFG